MDQTTLRIILAVIGVIMIAIIVLRRKRRKG